MMDIYGGELMASIGVGVETKRVLPRWLLQINV